MTSRTPPSRLVQRCIRALMPNDEADAVLGDLNEDAGVRTGTPSAVGLEWRAWRYVLALIPAALQRGGRVCWHVVRDAARALRAAPGASAGIVLILTLGIAAATVTFSVVDTVVLRPLPFEAAQELAVVELHLTSSESAFQSRSLGPYHYLTLRDHLTALESLVAVTTVNEIKLNAGDEPERLESVQATASLFEALRVRAFMGQTFTAEHEVEGNDRVAVISHAFWQRRFGGDPGIVGRSVTVTRRATSGGAERDESLTVLGVMPRGFTYPMAMVPAPDIWTPYLMTPQERTGERRGQYLHVVGRLRPGASLERAQFEARSIAASWDARDQEDVRTRQFHVVALKDTLVERVRGWMLLVLGAVTVVMLIACVNVANLQLVRATRRTRELSIRASLGATRRQLIASLIAESLLLSLIAAVLAIGAATWGIQMAKAGLPANLARVTEIGLDLRVLTATISAAVITGLLFGVVPAWQASREDLVGLLKQGTMTLGIGRRRWRSVFVIAEVAFVSLLLVGATLIISSFVRVTTADLGFDRSNLLFVSGETGVEAADTVVAVERLQHLPGVAAVGAMALGSPPLVSAGFRSGGASATTINPAGRPPGPEALIAEIRSVSSGYFAAAGIPIVSGRVFDDRMPTGEIAIDERIATQLFGADEAVGAEVITGDGNTRTVVAVVRHVHLRGPEQTSGPQVYVPVRIDRGRFDLLIRTSAPPATVIPAIRAAFPSAVTSGPAAMQIRPLEDAFRNITADRRFNAGLMSIFSVLAVVIGAAGVYGVLASIVAQQTREMAVRVALGATTGRMVAGVIAQAGRYLAAGLVVGLAVAWWASQGLASILYDIRPTDAGVYATVAGVMITVGVLAACVPAWRASRVDPVVALRAE
ncbi:MAG: hypothetical protein ABS36_04090 [Acidobacteria bacterium SCN 69-37]|nr:MAG: hypothetical protein ABS36_04090 [Acidobacteria bacterium SCN 69-37]